MPEVLLFMGGDYTRGYMPVSDQPVNFTIDHTEFACDPHG